MYTPWHEKILLYRLAQNRDPEAFGELYDRYAPKIYRYLYFKVSTVAEAEDLTAEVFLKTWEYVQRGSASADGVREGKPIANFRAFVYRLARNLVVDHYRERVLRETAANDEELAKVPEPPEKSIAAAVARSSDLVSVERALRTLKDEYREVVILRYVEELSTVEIARVLEKSKGAVRVTIHRALEALREELARTETAFEEVVAEETEREQFIEKLATKDGQAASRKSEKELKSIA